MSVRLSDARGQPLAAPELTTLWALPAAGIEPLERPLRPSGAGRFTGEVGLPVAGRWSVRIDARVSDFEKVVFRSELNVAASDAE